MDVGVGVYPRVNQRRWKQIQTNGSTQMKKKKEKENLVLTQTEKTRKGGGREEGEDYNKLTN